MHNRIILTVPEECYYLRDQGGSYRGTHNMTVSGPCQPWKPSTTLEEKYVADLQENFCRK